MKHILCLDIDDCILQNNSTYVGQVDDDIEVLKLNLKRLQLIIKKYNLELFLSSSWCYNTKVYNGMLVANKIITITAREQECLHLINLYLDNCWVGVSEGDRNQDALNLLEQGYTVLAIDDIKEFYDINHPKFKLIEVTGFLDNAKLFEIDKFLKKVK